MWDSICSVKGRLLSEVCSYTVCFHRISVGARRNRNKMFAGTNESGYAEGVIDSLLASKEFAIDFSYNDVKCGKIDVTLNMIGSTFLQSQSNFV